MCKEQKEILRVSGLCAGYGKEEIIHEVSFCLREGEVTGVIGTNGSGKTTLMKALCGILPSTGEISCCGEDFKKKSPKERAKICGYIPQRSGITLSISVIDVVLMGFNPDLGIFGNPTKEQREKAEKILEIMGLTGLKDRDYLTLSEGQKQMVILARTLAAERKILYLDEPESSLDFTGRYRMMEEIKTYVDQKNAAALLILHDPNLALSICDRILLLKDGRITDEIQPEIEDEESLSRKLSAIYGPVSMHRLRDRKGKMKTVLLREEEQ